MPSDHIGGSSLPRVAENMFSRKRAKAGSAPAAMERPVAGALEQEEDPASATQ